MTRKKNYRKIWVSEEFYELLLKFEKKYRIDSHVEATRRLVPVIERCLKRKDYLLVEPQPLKLLERLFG